MASTATSERLLTELEEGFLTCSICCLPYNQPKALPCLHPFCKGCLESYAFRTSVRTENGLLLISCPICRQQCAVPSSGKWQPLNNIVFRYFRTNIFASFYFDFQQGSKGYFHLGHNVSTLLQKGVLYNKLITRYHYLHLLDLPFWLLFSYSELKSKHTLLCVYKIKARKIAMTDVALWI